jgi:2'-5' RNA ligase
LAILPPEDFSQQVYDLKLSLKADFGVKYALKSPAHITLKMPFLYNSKSEDRLYRSLQGFSRQISSFPLSVEGVDQFRRRVLFLAVEHQPQLLKLQESLNLFCRKGLKLNLELSDTNYHPHLTVAFQDIKKGQFDALKLTVGKAQLKKKFEVKSYYLLKRKNGIWKPQQEIFLAEA